MRQHLLRYAQLAAVVIVIIGCYQVLYPFIPAILFSAVACSSSWPVYLRIRQAIGGRSSWAALLMTILLIVLVIGPSTVLALSLADNVTAGLDAIKELLERGPFLPPDWLKQVPLVGEPLDGYWHRLAASREEVVALLKNLIEPTKNVIVGLGKAIGTSLLQLVMAIMIAFFFYRDGENLVRVSGKILEKLAGDLSDELLVTIDNTVTGVVHGIFGTALAQAAVAVLGFLIAGVPGALVLGTATFFLSMIPIGPPLVWGGAALWLFFQGSIGWSIFMVAWGLLAISSIDNFVKPYLISRSSHLPILLIVFGVFGGIVAFGFIGVFIGPPILAVGLTLLQFWIAQPALYGAKPAALTLSGQSKGS